MTAFVNGFRFRASIVLVALGLDLVVLQSQFETAIGSAACLERAKFELILCMVPPEWWSIALVAALALCLAFVLGTLFGRLVLRSRSL